RAMRKGGLAAWSECAAAARSRAIVLSLGSSSSILRLAPRSGNCVFDHLFHALVVRAFPIDAAAARTKAKAVVQLAHLRRHAFDHRLTRDILKNRVAFTASAERRHQRLELQGADDFVKLFLRANGAHKVAALDF